MSSMKVRFGECVLDTDGRVLLRGAEPVHLTPKAFQLLSCLVEARPRAVSKNELQEKLWPSTFVSEGNLATLVKETRIAIGDDARRPLFIRTVHGYGYAFSGSVDEAKERSHSILVLSLENVTGDRDLDYLCEGIAENITNAFSRVALFRVLSPRTARRWKGSGVEPEAIARELSVETMIQGRVSGAIGRLVIQVDAVDVASGTQIWGNRFRSDAGQVYRIEEDVAAEVVGALQLRLSPGDLSRLVHRYTSNPHAYDLYLRGRFQWQRRTEDGLRRAIEHFGRAVVADPAYALPHSGIADVYTTMGNRDLMAPREAFDRALQSATRALELEPGLAEAHASLGAIAEVHQWDWGEAARKYRRAIDLSPSYATAYQWYALHFARRGLPADAELQMARALDLDPFSVIGLTNAALIAYFSRDHQSAAERIEKALEVEPESVDGHLVRGAVREATGEIDAAIDDYRRAFTLSTRYTMSLAFLGHALGRRGDRTEAEEVLQRLEELRRAQHVSAIAFAMVNLGLDRINEVFAWMDEGVREKSGWLVYFGTEPRLDPLRGDARFARLLEKIGLDSAIS